MTCLIFWMTFATACGGQKASDPPGNPGEQLQPQPFLVGSQLAHLLRTSSVSSALKIPKEKLNACIKALKESDQKVIGSASIEESHTKSLEAAKHIIDESLGKDTWRPLRQFHLRAIGLAAGVRRDREIQMQLRIDAEQQKKITAKLAEQINVPVPLNARDFLGSMRTLRESRDAIVRKVLTKDQQEKWKELIGPAPAFELDPPIPLPAVPRMPIPSAKWPATLPGGILVNALDREDIRKELGFDEAHKPRLDELRETLRMGDEAFRNSHSNADSANIMELLQVRRGQAFSELEKTSAKAAKRWRQLELRAAGLLLTITGDPNIAKELEVTNAQRQQINAMIVNGQIPRPPPPAADPKIKAQRLRSFRMQVDTIIEEKVLSESQRSKWHELIGPSSDLDLLMMDFAEKKK